MADVNEVTAAKASIYLMLQENQELLEHFNGLMEKLEEIAELPAQERHLRFRELEETGAFDLQGLDIRHFAKSQSDAPLTPPQFLRRTHRRLVNTNNLINEFLKRGTFEEGEQLLRNIEEITGTIVDETDSKQVLEFRNKVTEIREAPLFQKYMEIKSAFIRSDPEIRAEAEILAAKESVEEGVEVLEQREEKLQSLGERMESGEVEPEQVLEELEGMELTPAGKS